MNIGNFTGRKSQVDLFGRSLYVEKMTSDFKRSDRVAQMIQRKLAQIIQSEVKDPRLPRFLTVSAVSISSDLAYAKIYITVLSDNCSGTETVEILNKAASYLRTALARTMKLRVVPQLSFVYDASIEYGNQLSQLIDDVNAKQGNESED